MTFFGFDTLDIEPTVLDATTYTMARKQSSLDSKSGKQLWLDRSGVATVERAPFRWVMLTRQEIQDFRDFRAARKGMLVPVWVPTYERDLILAHDVPADAAGIIIKACNYSRYAFPSAARQYLALFNGRERAYVKITAALASADTELLTLAAAPGIAFPAATTMISFLLLCRLAADDVPLVWENTTVASAELDFIEIPGEVPA